MNGPLVIRLFLILLPMIVATLYAFNHPVRNWWTQWRINRRRRKAEHAYAIANRKLAGAKAELTFSRKWEDIPPIPAPPPDGKEYTRRIGGRTFARESQLEREIAELEETLNQLDSEFQFGTPHRLPEPKEVKP